MWRVALKGIAAKKLRVLLTSVSVVLGVAFITGTLVLSDTITRTFDTLVVNVNGGLSAQIRGKSAFNDSQGNAQRNRIDASLLDAVRRVPGVHDADVSVAGLGVIVDKTGKGLNAGQGPPPLAFAWSNNTALNPMRLVSGTPPQQPNDIVIDKRSADRAHFVVGDQVRVVIIATKGVSAVYHLAGIGKFGSADSPAGASLVFFTTATAERLLAQPGKVDAIQVQADAGVSQNTLVSRLKTVVRGQPGVEVVGGAAVVQEGQDNFQRAFGFFKTFLLVFAFIALFVGTFVIYNTFSITVAQRTREYALLRAIGASRRQVTTSVFAEALVTGVVASLVGLGAGLLLASGLKALLAALGIDIPAGSTVVTSGTVTVALSVGIIVTLMASLFPALKASRVRPIAAMREVAIEDDRPSLRRTIAGVIVTALGLASLLNGLFGGGGNALANVAIGAVIIFIGVAILGPLVARPAARLIGAPLPSLRGVAGRLARDNAMRNPKRTASTASALMIGVGLVAFVTIFAASAQASIDHVIDSEMKADYIVSTSSQFSTLPPAVETDLRKVPGVELVSGVRFGSMKFAGSVKQIEAFDPTNIDQLFDISVSKGRLADLGLDGLGVYKTTASDHGWVIGSRVPVQYAKTGVKTLTVRAIYTQQALAGPYVISLANYEQNFTEQSDAVVIVKAAPGAAASVRPGINAVLKRYPNGKLQDRAEYKAAQAKQVQQLLNLIYAMLMMAVFIALFGIANTLALSIFERTREIGLLRAVGGSKAQVRSVVRWESVIIALFGTLLGLLIGVFFGWVLVRALSDQGIDRFSLPPGQLVVLVVLGAFVGTLAAWLPARRAARIDILQAITTN